MATLKELLPGDLVSSPGRKPAVFLTACPHPVYHHLLLVIWRTGNGRLRLDALHPGDEVGDVEPIEPAARAERLADALINAAAPEVH
jgi:hypothetical protein